MASPARPDRDRGDRDLAALPRPREARPLGQVRHLYAYTHSLCGAHLPRELTLVAEQDSQPWAAAPAVMATSAKILGWMTFTLVLARWKRWREGDNLRSSGTCKLSA